MINLFTQQTDASTWSLSSSIEQYNTEMQLLERTMAKPAKKPAPQNEFPHNKTQAGPTEIEDRIDLKSAAPIRAPELKPSPRPKKQAVDENLGRFHRRIRSR